MTLYAKWTKVEKEEQEPEEKEIENKTSNYSWWGGAGRRVSVVTQDSEKDNVLEKIKAKDEVEGTHNSAESDVSVDSVDEMRQAYDFAYEKGITTIDSYEDAAMDRPIKRNELAKMLSVFSVGLLWKEPEIWKEGCESFRDVKWQTSEMKSYIKTACELGLMGMESDWASVAKNFNPNDYVTRAQFGTTLSRLLYGDMNNLNTDWDKTYYKWYEKHLSALKINEIMTKVDWDWVDENELRWYVMLMLMRASD